MNQRCFFTVFSRAGGSTDPRVHRPTPGLPVGGIHRPPVGRASCPPRLTFLAGFRTPPLPPCVDPWVRNPDESGAMHSAAVTGIASRRNRAVWLREAVILAGYGLIAILATYPVAWGFFSAIPGYGQDDFQSLWNFWWVKKAVLDDGTSPFSPRCFFIPRGRISRSTPSLSTTRSFSGSPSRDFWDGWGRTTSRICRRFH